MSKTPKTVEELEEELCNYCPIPEEGRGINNYGNGPVMCEGSHCNDAYERYLEEFEEDEDE